MFTITVGQFHHWVRLIDEDVRGSELFRDAISPRGLPNPWSCSASRVIQEAKILPETCAYHLGGTISQSWRFLCKWHVQRWPNCGNLSWKEMRISGYHMQPYIPRTTSRKTTGMVSPHGPWWSRGGCGGHGDSFVAIRPDYMLDSQAALTRLHSVCQVSLVSFKCRPPQSSVFSPCIG